MINCKIEREILPFCQQHHIGTINYAPMHSGLTGRMTKERVANFPEDDFRRRAKNHQEPPANPVLRRAIPGKVFGQGRRLNPVGFR